MEESLQEHVPDSSGEESQNDVPISNKKTEWTLEEVDTIYKQVKREFDAKECMRFRHLLTNRCYKVFDEARKKQKFDNANYVQQTKRRRFPTDGTDEISTGTSNKPIRLVVPRRPLVPPYDDNSLHSRMMLFAGTVQHCRHRRSNTDTAQKQSVPCIDVSSLNDANERSNKNNDRLIPSYSFCVPISQPYRIEDQEELTFVPAIEKYGDELLRRRNVLSMHKTSYREDLVVFGAESIQIKENIIIDTLFQRLFVNENEYGQPVLVPPQKHQVWELIAKVTKKNLSRIQQRLSDRISGTNAAEIDKGNEIDNATRSQVDVAARRNQLDINYEKATDDFRTLWCRQCYVYDCNLHGFFDKPTVCVQTMLAKAKERDGYWENQIPSVNHEIPTSTPSFADVLELNDAGKMLFKQIYSISEGNFDEIACVLGVPVHVAKDYYSTQEPSDLLDVKSNLNVKIGKKDSRYYSVKNYKTEWYNKYRDTPIFSMFFPCLHNDTCLNASNCTCIANQFFCTNACSWNRYSQNFFRGCGCKEHCGTQCTCFLSKRECDPDLCGCTACTDPPNTLIATQKCRNDNMTMNRQPPLLLGISSVSGWGLFNRYALKAGDYVGKYVGELMSQDEADRRGLISDARECTYLFLISKDMTYDAGRKGNLLRFMNHSFTPNVEPRIMFVRGEQQIGFYAKTNIPEQTELLFNYHFKELCDDTLTDHPQSKKLWMKKPTDKPQPRIDANTNKSKVVNTNKSKVVNERKKET